MGGAPDGRRVLIVNAVASNVGDAAILLGEIRSLREAFGNGVTITVADDAPAVVSRLYPDVEFCPGLFTERTPGRLRGLAKHRRSLRRRWFSLALRVLPRAPVLAELMLDARGRAHLGRLRRSDIVIATGGTYLVGHYGMAARLLELRAAQAVRRPTYLFTQSLGPFDRSRDRRLATRVLRAVDHAFVRDVRSRDHLLGLGVPADRISVHADAAFALGGLPPGSLTGADRLRIAVSVRQWRHFRTREPDGGLEHYRRSVAAAVRRLVDLGAEVEFVSTCQGVTEYWADDSRFARRLVEDLLDGVPSVRVDEAFRRPQELVEHLRSFHLAVATRMHFGILAMLAGVPVVPIAYEFKTTELFARLGLEHMVEDIETVTPESLTATVEAALASSGRIRAAVAEALPGLRHDAGEPARFVAAGRGRQG